MDLFYFAVRVYYEDTDSGGLVYHANYLKFFERARTEWLRARGFEQATLHAEHRLIFVVRAMTVDFHQPARLDDWLAVHSHVITAKASLTFDHTLWREQNLLCSARVKVACVDADRRCARRIPPFLVDRDHPL